MLKNISKQYKATMHIARNKFNSNKILQLRAIKNSDPRKFWRIINTDFKKKDAAASLEDFYQFFKTINGNPI